MNDYSNENDNGTTPSSDIDDATYAHLLMVYQGLFVNQEGVLRVLGEDHPTSKLIEKAMQILHLQDFDAALRAYLALPEDVMLQIRYPWIGHPPSPDAEEMLCKAQTCPTVDYLQIDAWEEHPGEPRVDEEGHVVYPESVWAFGYNYHKPIRVQIPKGSDKRLVLDLLKKISLKLEQNWDELTRSNPTPDYKMSEEEDLDEEF